MKSTSPQGAVAALASQKAKQREFPEVLDDGAAQSGSSRCGGSMCNWDEKMHGELKKGMVVKKGVQPNEGVSYRKNNQIF